MLIYSWNVNSIKIRQPHVLDFLKRTSADYLLMQELKCEKTKFPEAVFSELGYHSHIVGQKTYNGVAIVTKHPCEVIAAQLPGIDNGEARFLHCLSNGMQIINVYVPNGQEVAAEKYYYKLEWYAALAEYLKKIDRTNLLIAGDFNVALSSMDVFDPVALKGQILFSEPEKNSLSKILDLDLTDSFRMHHPEGKFFSWWDYRNLSFPKNRGLRIDYVFLGPGLKSRCAESLIDRDERKREQPSDHVPVGVRLE